MEKEKSTERKLHTFKTSFFFEQIGLVITTQTGFINIVVLDLTGEHSKLRVE